MGLYMQQLHELIQACHWIGQQGWVPACSGNFSIKSDQDCIWVSVSGVDKATLTSTDFIRVNDSGRPLDANQTPSAETLLHTTLYRFFSEARCILHTHSYYATMLSLTNEDFCILQNLELLKAFPSHNTHETSLKIPIFDNTQDMCVLSQKLTDYLTKHPDTVAFLIRGHGIYTWGNTVQEAKKHLDALEFLFKLTLGLRSYQNA